MPPASSAKDLPGGQAQVLNVRCVKQTNCHPAKSDDECSSESISDTENCLNWNGVVDNPNNSRDTWEADNESDNKLDNSSVDSDSPEQRNVGAAPNVPRLIQPVQRAKRKVQKASMTENIMETRRNKAIKKK